MCASPNGKKNKLVSESSLMNQWGLQHFPWSLWNWLVILWRRRKVDGCLFLTLGCQIWGPEVLPSYKGLKWQSRSDLKWSHSLDLSVVVTWMCELITVFSQWGICGQRKSGPLVELCPTTGTMCLSFMSTWWTVEFSLEAGHNLATLGVLKTLSSTTSQNC